MAGPSPRSRAQNSRRPIVDNSTQGDIQSGKIPIITATPRGEKANPDLNKRARIEHDKESGEAEIG